MHEGHRRRLTLKVLEENALYEHELLEVLLFNACPRRDLNACAHSLLNEFGSIEGVLSAPAERLAAVEGVGVNMAEYIACLGKCLKRCNDCSVFACIRSTYDFKKLLAATEAVPYDRIAVYMVDKDCRARRNYIVRANGAERAALGAGDVFGALSLSKTYGVFAAYIRANGDCIPVEEDDALCKALADVCMLCNVRFYDFCVVGSDGTVFSYRVEDRMVDEQGLITGERNG